MRARTLTIFTALLDLKNAFLDLLREKHKYPALLNIYCFIDICASLTRKGNEQNQEIFRNYLSEFAILSRWKRYTPYDLWAARSSILHTFSPLGHHTNKKVDNAKPIYYFSWPEKREDVEAALKAKGYGNFIVMDIIEIKSIAIDAFNTFHSRLEKDPEFENMVLQNSEHFLLSLHQMRLQEELREK